MEDEKYDVAWLMRDEAEFMGGAMPILRVQLEISSLSTMKISLLRSLIVVLGSCDLKV